MVLLRQSAAVAANACWQRARLNAAVVMMLFGNMLACQSLRTLSMSNENAVLNSRLC